MHHGGLHILSLSPPNSCCAWGGALQNLCMVHAFFSAWMQMQLCSTLWLWAIQTPKIGSKYYSNHQFTTYSIPNLLASYYPVNVLISTLKY
jgi:hypothetical protein